MDTHSLSTYLWKKGRQKQATWLAVQKQNPFSPSPTKSDDGDIHFVHRNCQGPGPAVRSDWGIDWLTSHCSHTHTQTLFILTSHPPLLPPSPHTIFPLTMLHRHIHTLSFPLTMFHLLKWLTSHPHALLPSPLPSVLSTDIHRQVTDSHIFSHHLSLCFIHNY